MVKKHDCAMLYGYSFMEYIKRHDIHKNIAVDVEIRFDTSDYKLDRPLSNGKNKKVIGFLLN